MNKWLFVFSLLIILSSIDFIKMDGAVLDKEEVLIRYQSERSKQEIMHASYQVINRYENIPVLSVLITHDNKELLRNNDDISYIEKNAIVKLTGETAREINQAASVESQWNMYAIGAPHAWSEKTTGKGVDIAIIDTGVAEHADLNIKGGYSTINNSPEWVDDNGHGTHIAGIIGAKHNKTGISGVAPDANLYAVKALNQDGEGSLADIVEAIDWAIQQDIDIVNLSLGTSFNSEILEDIIKKAYEEGTLIVGASGNEGKKDSVIYPSKYPEVIAVSATNKNNELGSFSSTGPEVELAAPGVNIRSTYLNDTYATYSGTSQAAPHVTGMLALLKQKYPELAYEGLRKLAADYTTDLGDPGNDVYFGAGLIDFRRSDQIAPQEVSDVVIKDKTQSSISVMWENPEDTDFRKTNLYLDSKLISSVHSTENPVFTFSNMEADKTYLIKLTTVDNFSNESTGITLTVKTKTETNHELKPSITESNGESNSENLPQQPETEQIEQEEQLSEGAEDVQGTTNKSLPSKKQKKPGNTEKVIQPTKETEDKDPGKIIQNPTPRLGQKASGGNQQDNHEKVVTTLSDSSGSNAEQNEEKAKVSITSESPIKEGLTPKRESGLQSGNLSKSTDEKAASDDTRVQENESVNNELSGLSKFIYLLIEFISIFFRYLSMRI
ncbi:S8 family peptidase [Sediminibacillus halophilus]|uniref:Minor extracellular protease Epr n=1 Tax=Sediminibacillus halophilus TaxID=482461 RepID=A0A1G9MAV4_9BACI|nr:S8 family peptidase [Sediminibacillus halophilus]SDL71422.1 minor extracellular protease Epr [Sediminibacillus halophilus]